MSPWQRLRRSLLALAVLAFALAAASGARDQAIGAARLPGAAGAAPPDAAAQPLPRLVQIGFHNLGGRGFTGDLWLHGHYAYIGTWGLGGPGLCLGTGARIVDVTNPLEATLLTTLPAPGTRVSEVQIETVNTAFFQGDLLVNSNEACAFGGPNGIQLWNVTDPRNPVALGRFNTGPVHNFIFYQRGDRAYVLLAVPYAEVFGPSGGFPASDFQVVDVTNPNNPTLIGQWTIGRDGGLAFGSPDFAGDPGLPPGSDCTPPPGTPALCRGNDYPAVFLHDVLVSADRLTAYLAYWDGGVVILDVSDPAAPAFVGRGQVPATFGSDEGNTHSAAPASPNLLLLADEDFTAGPWGFVRIFDITNPASPTQVGAFATLRTMANPPPDAGWYTAHHPMVQGSVAYVGWYSDGVHVFDFSNPAQPKEVASFQPPNVPDPNGVLPPNALVWSAHPHGETVLAADMNAGLYILGYDNDGDGCGDLQEASSNQVRGGRRDPASFWDFFDMPTGPAALRDRRVTIGDITAVVARFGSTGSPSIDPLSPPPRAPGYHTAYDRTPTPSGDPWDSAAPNGGVSIQDIVLAVAQFGHTCA